MEKKNSKICVGQFAGAHGVRGLAKLRSFTTDPESIFAYAPLSFEDGREVKVERQSAGKDHFLVSVADVTTKEAADALRGHRLYIPRDKLPATKENEFYDADLVGLRAVDASGAEHGRVMAVHDYGAGVFLEIGANKKDSFMLPFKDAFVPAVDIDGGKISIVVPDNWIGADATDYSKRERLTDIGEEDDA